MDEIYTPEEMTILGMDPETPAAGQEPPDTGAPSGEAAADTSAQPPENQEAAPDVKEPEHTEEEARAAESMGLKIDNGFIIDDDGTKIPAKRWKALYREHQENKRGRSEIETKFNEFKELGPERYYEKYPAEVPEGWTPPARKEPPAATPSAINTDIGSMIVQGGEYDGYTLDDLFSVKPAYAIQLQQQYYDSIKGAQQQEEQRAQRLRQDVGTEISNFKAQMAQETYQKDVKDLTPDELAAVTNTMQDLYVKMIKTGRCLTLQDAYILANKDKIVNDAKAKGGKEALESLQKGSIPSIGAGGSVAAGNNYESMTADELASKIANMSDDEAAKFFKNAPASLKAKYPSVPWI